MSLKEIFCQDRAIGILQRAFACGRMPHAYIFSGLEGVGRFKTACELSKLLLCKEPVKEKTGSGEFADSCGRCESCKLFEAGSHPDFNLIYKELLEFTRDNKGKKTPVDLPKDVVREFLIDKVSMRPTLSKSKVFVVSEAERLNNTSQNTLLKVLEEPPGYCFVILLCTRLEKLLPTTKSRCQIIRFAPIDEEIIIGKLREMGIGQKQAQYFGRLAQGSLGQGCRWANLELADANLYQIKEDLVASVATFEYAKSLELARRFLDEGKSIAAASAKLEAATSKTDINRRASKTLIRIVISALQDAMKLGLEADKNIINFDQKEEITKLAGRFSSEQIAGKISNCYEALRWIDASVNEKLIFEQLLLNLAVSDTMKV